MTIFILSLFFILALHLVKSKVPVWSKCGGIGHTTETTCDSSSICVEINQWYSQCQPKPNDPNRVNEWSQCGGIIYNGNVLCQTWLTCVKLNDWYSNCQFIRSSTIKTSSSSTTISESSPLATNSEIFSSSTTISESPPLATNSEIFSSSTTISESPPLATNSEIFSSSTTISESPPLATNSEIFSSSTTIHPSTALNGQCNPSFQSNRLKVGISFDWTLNNNVDYDNFDYISIWLAYSDEFGTDFNPWFHGPMINAALAKNKSAVFYMYLIAFQARYNLGIRDCDVDYNYNLCVHGAEFIRNYRQLLVDKYRYHAKWISERFGREKRAVFAIEPDFVQYYSDQRQIGGPLTGQYMRELFDDFVSALKSELPNALISWDISPWLGVEGMRTWWGYFETAQIDFIHTSGGSLRPDLPQIRQNELEWRFMSNLTKKYIISNCGYGVGGANINDCDSWISGNNLNIRINDGVIAVTIASGSTIVPRGYY
ncbi:hypothetical protein BpHYR1_014851 [Brachionus plicatilis]|uniref:CBM1 domain-containing protein n=1 Tax=Brachionus plicatilis TaxID=10195 RepID=A0A3M7Q824_BRAPC|nr:hypothetical protein BpHYR1_014851 [Brachionus plicatilis]